MREPNYFQAASSAEKLRGRYYTPPALVSRIYERLDLRPDDLVIDPSCGDGEFLVGAVEYLTGRFGAADPDRLIGLDVNPEAVTAARARLEKAIRWRLGEASARVYRRDALDLNGRGELLELVGMPAGCRRLVVAGTPPYVEAKRLALETRRALKRRFPDASTGAPDLYVYFTHVCLGWLSGEDRLAFVLPNKVLVNGNARGLRRRLLEGALEGIDFATQARLFGEAAVYPIVVYAGARAASPEVTLTRLERTDASGLHAVPLPPWPRASYGGTESLAFFPTPESRELSGVLQRLLAHGNRRRLDEVLDIRWTVSFHRRGLRERYVLPERPTSAHARRFVGGGAFSGNGEVERYRLSWGGWWIDYDEERARRDGNQLPPGPLFDAPKVVICQNGRSLRAAYDDAGHVLKDTLLCGLPRDVDHPLARRPRAVIGLLCSRAAHFFYSHVFYGGHVNGGYLHFLRSFLVDLPVGRWPDAEAARAAELVERLERAGSPSVRMELEERIEELVSQALGLSPGEREAIRGWAEADLNWQLRERTRLRSLLPAPHAAAGTVSTGGERCSETAAAVSSTCCQTPCIQTPL